MRNAGEVNRLILTEHDPDMALFVDDGQVRHVVIAEAVELDQVGFRDLLRIAQREVGDDVVPAARREHEGVVAAAAAESFIGRRAGQSVERSSSPAL